jgi:hypothetical protein
LKNVKTGATSELAVRAMFARSATNRTPTRSRASWN